MRAEYCDERVCVSVCLCLSAIISTRPIITKFSVHVASGRGSVLLWQRSDMSRISRFIDAVMFAHKLRLSPPG